MGISPRSRAKLKIVLNTKTPLSAALGVAARLSRHCTTLRTIRASDQIEIGVCPHFVSIALAADPQVF
jgi:hypothetical protein